MYATFWSHNRNVSDVQTDKLTSAIRETSVSRHNGAPIEVPLNTIVLQWFEGFELPWYGETVVSRTYVRLIDVVFPFWIGKTWKKTYMHGDDLLFVTDIHYLQWGFSTSFQVPRISLWNCWVNIEKFQKNKFIKLFLEWDLNYIFFCCR